MLSPQVFLDCRTHCTLYLILHYIISTHFKIIIQGSYKVEVFSPNEVKYIYIYNGYHKTEKVFLINFRCISNPPSLTSKHIYYMTDVHVIDICLKKKEHKHLIRISSLPAYGKSTFYVSFQIYNTTGLSITS